MTGDLMVAVRRFLDEQESQAEVDEDQARAVIAEPGAFAAGAGHPDRVLDRAEVTRRWVAATRRLLGWVEAARSAAGGPGGCDPQTADALRYAAGDLIGAPPVPAGTGR